MAVVIYSANSRVCFCIRVRTINRKHQTQYCVGLASKIKLYGMTWCLCAYLQRGGHRGALFRRNRTNISGGMLQALNIIAVHRTSIIYFKTYVYTKLFRTPYDWTVNGAICNAHVRWIANKSRVYFVNRCDVMHIDETKYVYITRTSTAKKNVRPTSTSNKTDISVPISSNRRR